MKFFKAQNFYLFTSKMTEPEIIKFHQQVLLKLQEAIELTTMLGDEAKLKEYKTEYERVKSDDKYFRERYLA